MPPESPTPGSPADWLRRARSDLTLARLSPPDGVLREDLCFHAQQAAEKALKALWVALEQPVPRTHNLKTLLEGSTPRLAIPDSVRRAASLTVYAVLTRYPADLEPVTPDEHRDAVARAEAVVRWVETTLASPA
ncbi:MAG: DNA-binding protein [Rhodothermaceae bacterium]|nr:MAG: DNA-binding protein [Rhodothermaceae bacterium]